MQNEILIFGEMKGGQKFVDLLLKIVDICTDNSYLFQWL